MRTSTVLLTCLPLLALPFGGAPTTTAGDGPPAARSTAGSQPEFRQDHDPRDLVDAARISLRDAIERALRVRSGQAVEAELEAEDDEGKRVVFFEVMIVTDGPELHEVKLDARSGEVLEMAQATDDDELAELAEFRNALRHAELGLGALIARGEDFVKGTAVKAKLGFEDGSPECELLFVNTRYLIEADLEGRAGHLVDLGLESDASEEDHAHDGHGEEGEDGEDGEEGEDGEDGEDGEAGEKHGKEHEEEAEEEEEHEGKEHAEEAQEEAHEGGAERRESGREEAESRGERVTAPSLTPLSDRVRFTDRVDHPYFPLTEIRYAVFKSEDARVVRKVLNERRVVGGVECIVLAEEEYEDGALAEISYNFFAQDPRGNVYYFGEDVDDYQDGKVVGHGGAWKVGVNAKEPCLFMPRELRPGFRFKPENSPPAAEEFDEIAGTDAELKVPAGRFTGVLVIREGDKQGEWKEKKFYARGVGLISENGELELTEYVVERAGDTEREERAERGREDRRRLIR